MIFEKEIAVIMKWTAQAQHLKMQCTKTSFKQVLLQVRNLVIHRFLHLA